MKITFILPFAGITGGIKHYFSLANGLTKLGHDVNLIYPGKLFPKNDLRWKIERILRKYKYSWDAFWGKEEAQLWFDLKAKIKKAPDLSARYIPTADIVIATANETADWVVNYPPSKGEKFYYVLDYEIWARDRASVERTFKMPLKKIVLGSWQKSMLENKFHEPVLGIVPGGIDLAVFHPNPKIKKSGKRILILYHPLPYKGVNDAIEAFKLAKKQFQDIKLVIFGVHPVPYEILELDPEVYYKLSEKEIAQVYQSADIFIWPSHREGFGLPPLEAMACGCAVITTNSGSVADFTNKKSAVVVPVKNPKRIAKELINLLKDTKKTTKIASEAIKIAQKFSYEAQTKKFERILQKYLVELKSKHQR